MKIFVVISVIYILFGQSRGALIRGGHSNISNRSLNAPVMRLVAPEVPNHHPDHQQRPQTVGSSPMKPPSSQATIVKQEYERFKDGGYRFFYETSDGQSREEVGFFRDDPRLGKVLTVHGSYGYISPNKKKVFVKYTSDERGYMSFTSAHPPAHLPSNIINQQLNGLKS